MSYVSATDVQERLGDTLYVELTDDTGSGSADLDKINEAIQGAEGEVNSYVGLRYVVPVDLTGQSMIAEVLKSFVLDLVEQRLHGRRPPVPEDIRRKRSEALTWLKRVADGEIVLPSSSAVPRSAEADIPGKPVGTPRRFTRDELSSL